MREVKIDKIRRQLDELSSHLASISFQLSCVVCRREDWAGNLCHDMKYTQVASQEAGKVLNRMRTELGWSYSKGKWVNDKEDNQEE